MEKTYSISRSSAIFIVLVMLMIGFILGASFTPERIIFTERQKTYARVDGERVVEMGIPAVDMEGNGVIARLITTIRPGTGQVLVNVNDVLAQFDTQISGRSAAKAVANVTSTDLSNLDIIYDIKVNATIIEGPSAGATMAASIYTALQNMQPTNDIMMSGTISDDGKIGPVGAVKEKAGAAKAGGARIFLVPENQSSDESSTRTRICRQVDSVEVCEIRYTYGKTNIGLQLNITVEEVRTLEDIINIYRKESAVPGS